MAEQIEKLNENPFFKPETFMDRRLRILPANIQQRIRQHFYELPEILRWYGACVEKQPSEIGRFRRSSAGRRQSHQVVAILGFLLLNKIVIKRPCYPEVAEILNALVPRDGGDGVWTESHLEKMYRDHVTKRLKKSPARR